MQSATSRIAAWMEKTKLFEIDDLPYEERMALLELRHTVEQWTEVRRESPPDTPCERCGNQFGGGGGHGPGFCILVDCASIGDNHEWVMADGQQPGVGRTLHLCKVCLMARFADAPDVIFSRYELDQGAA